MIKAKQDSWGFDLTHFADGARGANSFKAILDAMELPNRPKRSNSASDRPLNSRPFVWKIKGLRLVTGNNPLTGQYYIKGQRENELGYASYIGITGDAELVAKLAKLISSNAESIKDETAHESRFIG